MPNLTRVKHTIKTVHLHIWKRRGTAASLYRVVKNTWTLLGEPLDTGWSADDSVVRPKEPKKWVDFYYYDIDDERASDLRNATNVAIAGIVYKISDKTPPSPGVQTRVWYFRLDPTGEKVPT